MKKVIASIVFVLALGACGGNQAVESCVDQRLANQREYDSRVNTMVAEGTPRDAAQVIIKRELDVDKLTARCPETA